MPAKSTTVTRQAFTPHASLAALGQKLRALALFDPVRQHVDIHQKQVKDAPADKLFDAFVAILAGAHGLCEIETRLRADPVLQRAFGRSRCAGARGDCRHIRYSPSASLAASASVIARPRAHSLSSDSTSNDARSAAT